MGGKYEYHHWILGLRKVQLLTINPPTGKWLNQDLDLGLSDAKAQILASTLNFLQHSNGQRIMGSERGTLTSIWKFFLHFKSKVRACSLGSSAPPQPGKVGRVSMFYPPSPKEMEVFQLSLSGLASHLHPSICPPSRSLCCQVVTFLL